MGVGAAVAGATAVAGVAGAAMSADATKSAAKTQANAANRAADMNNDQINDTKGTLHPYEQTGLRTLGYIPGLIGATDDNLGNPLTAPLTKFNYSGQEAPEWNDTFGDWNPTQEGLESTPGYQFSLNQGLKGVQNSYAAKGLANSGAALKGAADYAQGLADKTYQEQFSNYGTLFNQNQAKFSNFQNLFQNYLNQNSQDYAHQQQIFGMLSTIAGSGQNAAVQMGAMGQQAANANSQLLTAAGAANAAGQIGSANAISQGIGSISSAGQLYGLLNSGLLGGASTNPALAGMNGAGTGGTTPGSSVNTNYGGLYTGAFSE